MNMKILAVLSEYGYWGEELVGPLQALDKQGYTVDFATPTGKRAHALPPSMDAGYIDPPLGRSVVSKEMELAVKQLEATNRLDNPLALNQLIPERPYLSSENYLHALENYYHRLEQAEQELSGYDALLLVGGSGPVVDMVNNQRVHDLVLAFYKANKLIAAECYGVAVLAFARDCRDKQSIIWGKHVTGHPLEYDYKDGTGFLGVDFNMGPPPYPLEYILRDATGPEGQYHSNVGNRTSVIVDYPFLTSRSTASSVKCGEKMVEVLEQGLTSYGW
ncbi:type 1 glutamine amidotransferase domain-containing protein [Vibrio navarrensis]|nr:type 1 glutamine amidotransferase domain-containing protein [Vibrio navarrensis]